jgi:hypothetical protein
LNLPIGFKNQLLVVAKSRQGLAKCKQVLSTMVAFERLRYEVLAALHAAKAEARQSEGIPFSGKDGVQDPAGHFHL